MTDSTQLFFSQALISYTGYHFDSELQLFERCGIPQELLGEHETLHSDFSRLVVRLKEKYDTEDGKDSNMELMLETLVQWLTEHILESDMRLCLISLELQKGVGLDQAFKNAEAEMIGPRGGVSRVMRAMMEVSGAGVLALRREIDRRTRLEDRLKNLALHDMLTGLPNRLLLEEIGANALALADRNRLEQAVLFVDIDQFKAVNDTLGHAAGDRLLVEIAGRLKKCVRQSDTVARIGGDEFTVHLGGDCKPAGAVRIAKGIIEVIGKPFDLEEGVANVGASVGIAMFPADGKDFKSLVNVADAAMYVAKKAGKNGYCLARDV